MKRKLLVAVPLLCVVVVLAWFFRPKHEYLGEAYVSERSTTLWSSVAQVRAPIDTLHYGDRVDVMARRNDSVKVRTGSGASSSSTSPKPCPCRRAAAPKCKPIFVSGPDARSLASISSAVEFQSRSSHAPSPIGCKSATSARTTKRRQPRRRIGSWFAAWPPALLAKSLPAAPNPIPPRSPVIRPFRSPAGSWLVLWSLICLRPCAKAWRPPTSAPLPGSS